MNFYDKVHELVRELKDTEEYTTYIKIKEEIKQNQELYNKVKSFKDRQRVQHMKYLSGEKTPDEEMSDLQNTYSVLIQEELIAKFFQAEIKLDVLLADIQKILGEGIKDIVEF